MWFDVRECSLSVVWYSFAGGEIGGMSKLKVIGWWSVVLSCVKMFEVELCSWWRSEGLMRVRSILVPFGWC